MARRWLTGQSGELARENRLQLCKNGAQQVVLVFVLHVLVLSHSVALFPLATEHATTRESVARHGSSAEGRFGQSTRVLRLRGGTEDDPGGHADAGAGDLAQQREARKKAKAEEKLRKKLAKEATRAEWSAGGANRQGDVAGSSHGIGSEGSASTGATVSYSITGADGLPDEYFGDLVLVQVKGDGTESAPEGYHTHFSDPVVL